MKATGLYAASLVTLLATSSFATEENNTVDVERREISDKALEDRTFSWLSGILSSGYSSSGSSSSGLSSIEQLWQNLLGGTNYNGNSLSSIWGLNSRDNDLDCSSGRGIRFDLGSSDKCSKTVGGSGFWWGDKSVCLASGVGSSKSCPSGLSCPDDDNWVYYNRNSDAYCVPRTSDAASYGDATTCKTQGHYWSCGSAGKQVCKPITIGGASKDTDCKETNSFFWDHKDTCCNSKTTGGTCPSGKSCPDNWIWDPLHLFCTPKTKTDSTNTGCSTLGHFFSSGDTCCKGVTVGGATSSDKCTDDNSVWWKAKNTCCNSKTKPGTPPTGKSCPTNWIWDPLNLFCSPTTSDEGKRDTPTCTVSGHSWDSLNFCCTGSSSPSNGKCTNGLFLFGLVNICLPDNFNDGTSNKCPSHLSCPSGWNYSSKYGYCVPSNSDCQKSPTCSTSGHSWFPGYKFCTTPSFPGTDVDCKATGLHFHWNSTCNLNNYNPGTSCPDTDKSCPQNWYWSTTSNTCVPTASNCAPAPSACSNSGHSWDWDWLFCHDVIIPPNNGKCSKNQWLWSFKNQCVSNSCPDPKTTCPTGTSCPVGWYYHATKKYCYPSYPGCSTPIPQCQNTHHWWGSKDCFCSPNGASQHVKKRKRARGNVLSTRPLGTVDSARCPDKLTACPVADSLEGGSAYECIDPHTELESCGGCATLGTGVDCTAIPGSRSVSCELGVCQVYTCSPGYVPSIDGQKCVRSKASLLQSQHKKALRAKVHSF